MASAMATGLSPNGSPKPGNKTGEPSALQVMEGVFWSLAVYFIANLATYSKIPRNYFKTVT